MCFSVMCVLVVIHVNVDALVDTLVDALVQYVTVTWMLPVSPTFDCLGLSDRWICGCWPIAASAAQPFLISFFQFFLVMSALSSSLF